MEFWWFSVDRLDYESLKAEQEMAVSELLGGKDVFVVLPTGYSKLLCYACFPDLWRPFLASETSAEHGDKAACIYKHFQTSY